MRLNNVLNQNISEAKACLFGLKSETFRLPFNGKVWAQDYFCWLENSIIADYETITFLFQNMTDINVCDLRPLYCILRSSLEKYADTMNFVSWGREYEMYLQYLNLQAAAREEWRKQDSQNAQRISEEAEKQKNTFQERFHLKKCNRYTRYYMLRESNGLLQEHERKVGDFNKRLACLDSKCSRIHHNNLDMEWKSNKDKAEEILRTIHLIMYDSLNLFLQYYGDNYNPYRTNAICKCRSYLMTIVDSIDNGCWCY